LLDPNHLDHVKQESIDNIRKKIFLLPRCWKRSYLLSRRESMLIHRQHLVSLVISLHLWDISAAGSLDEAILHTKSTTHVGTTPWLREQYPRPYENAGLCRTPRSSKLCDPDSILTNSEISSLEASLVVDRRVEIRCPDTTSDSTGDRAFDAPVQFAVALVRKVSQDCQI
jgi:Modulator of levamisole receptor-1